MTIYSSGPGYINLRDGPAKDRRFYVQRAPVYLRVVQDINGKWDVLDLLEDEPTPEEEIFVYKQETWMHVRANDRRNSGVHYKYFYVPIQPELKGVLRYRKKWQQWAQLARVAEE